MISDENELYLALDRNKVESILIGKFGIPISEICGENGWGLFDDLDSVEFIMELEKDFEIAIDDFLFDHIISNVRLDDFLSNITITRRNLNLDKLGI